MKSRKRAKMIVSLVTLAVLVLVVVPLALALPFNDVPPGYWAYEAIDRISNLHITVGCGGGNYCPGQNVTRAQMAGFINNLTKAYTNEDEPYIMSLDHQYWGPNPPAFIAKSNDGTGVQGFSYGGGWADNGVYGETNTTDSYEGGVYGLSTAAGSGVFGYNSNPDTTTSTSYGVRAYSTNGYGLYSYSPTDYGAYVEGAGGVYSHATAGHAARAVSDGTGYAGAWFSAGWNGVFAEGGLNGGAGRGLWASSESSYAVYADAYTAGGYGLYTDDKIYAGSGCVGCTSLIIAQNGGEEALEAGDLVAVVGIAEGPTEFYSRPVLLVRKADSVSGLGIVGVVEGRYVSELVARPMPRETLRYEEVADPEAEKNGEKAHAPDVVPVVETWTEEVTVEEARTTTEPAAPGDKLTVVYRGIVQVKVDAAPGAIQVGDLLTLGTAGWAAKAQPAAEGASLSAGSLLGKALEPLSEGQGLIWVLVDLQ